MSDLVLIKPVRPPGRPISVSANMAVPAIIAEAGETATRRFLEFFAASTRNKNTRLAYCRAVRHFFAWSEHHQLGGLDDISQMSRKSSVDLSLAGVKPKSGKIRDLFSDRLNWGRNGLCITELLHSGCSASGYDQSL